MGGYGSAARKTAGEVPKFRGPNTYGSRTRIPAHANLSQKEHSCAAVPQPLRTGFLPTRLRRTLAIHSSRQGLDLPIGPGEPIGKAAADGEGQCKAKVRGRSAEFV